MGSPCLVGQPSRLGVRASWSTCGAEVGVCSVARASQASVVAWGRGRVVRDLFKEGWSGL